MGEGSGQGSGRIGSDFLSAIAGRVGSGQRFAGSGPRKVTRGQLCGPSDDLASRSKPLVHLTG